QNQKQLSQRNTQDMNKSSSSNKILSLLSYYFQAMTLPPLWHVIDIIYFPLSMYRPLGEAY
ncbi:hypothetical protein NEAUS03_2403, partial [Nematocida ausubeli]